MFSIHRRIAIAIVAAGILLSAGQASAWDLDSAVQPQVTFHWEFGGARAPHSDLSLRLNYAADLRQPGVTLPALAEWSFKDSGADTLKLNGVPLRAGRLFTSENSSAETGERPVADPPGSGLKVALILLGAGGATALAIGALGNAAEANNPAVSDNQSGIGCSENPAASSCLIGGGG